MHGRVSSDAIVMLHMPPSHRCYLKAEGGLTHDTNKHENYTPPHGEIKGTPCADDIIISMQGCLSVQAKIKSAVQLRASPPPSAHKRSIAQHGMVHQSDEEGVHRGCAVVGRP